MNSLQFFSETQLFKWAAFGAAVCKIQARKRCIESLPSSPKIRSCFSQGERSLSVHNYRRERST